MEETFRINLKLEFATTETEVHQADLAAGTVPMAQELLRSITNKVRQRAKLPTAFAKLYPLVRTYVATRCFGKMVDVDSEAVRTHLRRLELQEGIAKYLARKIAALTVEKRTHRVREGRLHALQHQALQLATQPAPAAPGC